MIFAESHRRYHWIADAAVALAVLASIAVCVRGFVHSEMWTKIAWQPVGLENLARISAIYWATFLAIILTGRKALQGKLVGAALLVLAGLAGVVPVLSVLALVVSAAALGTFIWERLSGRGVSPEINATDIPLRAAIGLAALAAILPLLGLLPINGSLTYALILGIPLAWRGRIVARSLASTLSRDCRDIALLDLALLAALGNFVLIDAIAALLPEVGNDALALHLAVAASVRDFAQWHYDVLQHADAVIALGGDFLYAAAYMFSGETGARLTNLATLLLTLWLVYGAVRASGSRRMAILATMVAASSPLTVLESASLFIEHPWALFLVGALVCALRFANDPQKRDLYAGAMLFGAALSTKLIALAMVPALLFMLVVFRVRHPRELHARHVAVACALALAFAAPPYAIALAKTGNPVFPFFNGIFKSPLFPPWNATIPLFPGTLDPLSLYRMTFYSDRYIEGRPGSLGFAFLLLTAPLLVAAIAKGTLQVRLLVVAMVSFFAVVIAGVSYLRYLYPLVFVLGMMLGLTLGRLAQAWKLRTLIIATAGAAVVLNVPFLPAATPQVRSLDLQAVIDERARARYIAGWAPQREIVRFLNAYGADNSAVLLLGAPYVAELRRPSYTDSGYMRHFRERLQAVDGSMSFRRLLQQLRIGFVVLDSSEKAAFREYVQEVARPIYRSGVATLYKVDMRLLYPTELLKGIPFDERFTEWVEHGDVGWHAPERAALVNSSNLLYQPVPVRGEETYRLAVHAACSTRPAEYRLQVNWIDAEGRDLGPHLLVAPCHKQGSEVEELVTAPRGARTAVVYATGHGDEPVLVRSVSFRSRQLP